MSLAKPGLQVEGEISTRGKRGASGRIQGTRFLLPLQSPGLRGISPH
jgi:hypothetical protein